MHTRSVTVVSDSLQPHGSSLIEIYIIVIKFHLIAHMEVNES